MVRLLQRFSRIQDNRSALFEILMNAELSIVGPKAGTYPPAMRKYSNLLRLNLLSIGSLLVTSAVACGGGGDTSNTDQGGTTGDTTSTSATSSNTSSNTSSSATTTTTSSSTGGSGTGGMGTGGAGTGGAGTGGAGTGGAGTGGMGTGGMGTGGMGTGGVGGDQGVCGNAIVEPGEECDDANKVEADGCDNDCKKSGEKIWSIALNNAANGDDIARGVDVDASGNIFVTGTDTTAAQGRNILIKKLNSAGATLWSKSIDGADSKDDEGYGVAIDSGGNAIVVGYTTKGGVTAAFVRKFDTMGNVLWMTPNLGTAGLLTAVAIGTADNVLITGNIKNATNDILVAKLAKADGTVIWNKSFDDVNNQSDTAGGIAVDSKSNVVITGSAVTAAQRPQHRPRAIRCKRQHRLEEKPRRARERRRSGTSGCGRRLGQHPRHGLTPTIVGGDVNEFVSKWDPTGMPIWSFNKDGGSNKPDSGHAIARQLGRRHRRRRLHDHCGKRQRHLDPHAR